MANKWYANLNGFWLVKGAINGRPFDGNGDWFQFSDKDREDLEALPHIEFKLVETTTPSSDSKKVGETMDELSHIPRLELLRKIMQNVEDLIKHQSYLRDWWDRSPNWVRVQAVINNNTSKAGSMSSTRECVNIGINPDGYSTRDIVPPMNQDVREAVEAKTDNGPPLKPYMILLENVSGEPRALGVEGKFRKWCFRPIYGQWVTYQQVNEDQFQTLLAQEVKP